MMILFLTALVCLQIAGGSATELKCPLPPSLWCSSYDAATACGVQEQCKRNVWSRLDAPPQLVNFTLYYESLCPDCQGFIKTQLYPAFQAVGEIMNLTLVPYGNAFEKREGDKWKFECQHGGEECIGNLIDTCLLKIVKDVKKVFPLIHCMEGAGDKPMEAFEKCSKQFPLVPVSQIKECSTSKQGNEWEHDMALKTDALNPPHKYVPWVTLNGVHNEVIQNKAQKNLIQLICDTYTGTKPPGCQDPYKRKRCFK